MTEQPPDWDVAIVDGQPEQIVNLAMIAELVKQSPLGVDRAFDAAMSAIGEQYRARLRRLVYG